MNDVKVLIGMPCGSGLVPSVMVQSLLQLRKPCATSFTTVVRQRIDKVRNYMAKQALESGFDYLLMVDDDNPIPEDTLELMLEDDKDIVVAPIMTRNPNEKGERDLCAFYSEEKKIKENTLRIYNHITEFRDEGPLHRIDAGGTGCMMIRRNVLETLWKKYEGEPFQFGDITVDGQRRTMSEDAEFCERAVDEGFEIWLDERIKPFHIGNFEMIQWKK